MQQTILSNTQSPPGEWERVVSPLFNPLNCLSTKKILNINSDCAST